jgi:hypothetical protein
MIRAEIKNLSGTLTNALEFNNITEATAWVAAMGFKIPSERSVTYVDITDEVKQRNAMQESLETFHLSIFLKATIRTLNKKKLETGVWDNAKFTAFLSSPTIANAERALSQGSWTYYKSLVVQCGEFYTTEEMQQIISLVEQHETKWAAVLGG